MARCPLCSFPVPEAEVEVHLRRELRYTPYECLLCPTSFYRREEAQAHFDGLFPDHPGQLPRFAQRRDAAVESRLKELLDQALDSDSKGRDASADCSTGQASQEALAPAPEVTKEAGSSVIEASKDPAAPIPEDSSEVRRGEKAAEENNDPMPKQTEPEAALRDGKGCKLYEAMQSDPYSPPNASNLIADGRQALADATGESLKEEDEAKETQRPKHEEEDTESPPQSDDRPAAQGQAAWEPNLLAQNPAAWVQNAVVNHADASNEKVAVLSQLCGLCGEKVKPDDGHQYRHVVAKHATQPSHFCNRCQFAGFSKAAILKHQWDEHRCHNDFRVVLMIQESIDVIDRKVSATEERQELRRRCFGVTLRAGRYLPIPRKDKPAPERVATSCLLCGKGGPVRPAYRKIHATRNHYHKVFYRCGPCGNELRVPRVKEMRDHLRLSHGQVMEVGRNATSVECTETDDENIKDLMLQCFQ